MGGRGTFAAGKNVDYTYEVDRSIYPDGKIEGIKILKALPGATNHGLPASAHSSEAYIKLYSDGTFQQMNFYDKDHCLYLEIDYHYEYGISRYRTEKVLHYHTYDKSFSMDKNAPNSRSDAKKLTRDMYNQYAKYLKGAVFYD